jgi:hypothetical protein
LTPPPAAPYMIVPRPITLFQGCEAMRYLCLIHLDEAEMAAMPAHEMDALNAGHLDLNNELRASGHFIEAEALQPSREAAYLRRGKRAAVTDGPFTETKELVAGFYLLEARDMDEAVEIASRFPGGRHGSVEVRPCRELIVPGR